MALRHSCLPEEVEQIHGGSEDAVSEEFSGDHDQVSTMWSEKSRGMPATRITILRPITRTTRGAADDHRDAPQSRKAVQDGGMDMEDFLRELKERAERRKAETGGEGERGFFELAASAPERMWRGVG
ncbi:hypothetical protein D1007_23047 [Hordeum vulgare]|nr:hypothetical protein D1007_23047 [Hordeum vulgare]